MTTHTWRTLLTLCFLAAAVQTGLTAEHIPFEVGLYGGGHTNSEETKGHAAGYGIALLNLNQYLSGGLQIGAMNAPSRRVALPDQFLSLKSVEVVSRLYIAPPSQDESTSHWAPGICRPYLTAGVGLFSIGNGTSEASRSTGPDPSFFANTTYKVDDSAIGIVLGGGLDYTITPAITVGLDVAYVRLRPNLEVSSFSQSPGTDSFGNPITVSASSNVTKELDLDSVRLLLGIRYRFSR